MGVLVFKHSWAADYIRLNIYGKGKPPGFREPKNLPGNQRGGMSACLICTAQLATQCACPVLQESTLSVAMVNSSQRDMTGSSGMRWLSCIGSIHA
jgi:hypothetical protein